MLTEQEKYSYAWINTISITNNDNLLREMTNNGDIKAKRYLRFLQISVWKIHWPYEIIWTFLHLYPGRFSRNSEMNRIMKRVFTLISISFPLELVGLFRTYREENIHIHAQLVCRYVVEYYLLHRTASPLDRISTSAFWSQSIEVPSTHRHCFQNSLKQLKTREKLD